MLKVTESTTKAYQTFYEDPSDATYEVFIAELKEHNSSELVEGCLAFIKNFSCADLFDFISTYN